MQIDAATVLRLLPHREPLQLVDGAAITAPGVVGVVACRLTRHALLRDGSDSSAFRQELVLEAAAQSFGVVLGSASLTTERNAAFPQRDEKHLLLGFDDVRFAARDIPLDKTLHITVSRQQALGEIYCASFVVNDAGTPIAEGSVMVMKGKA
jgi:3-hydroxymyristoyl/3-hydroxydecanoyl-(acyl carrier protein) dehydratase